MGENIGWCNQGFVPKTWVVVRADGDYAEFRTGLRGPVCIYGESTWSTSYSAFLRMWASKLFVSKKPKWFTALP